MIREAVRDSTISAEAGLSWKDQCLIADCLVELHQELLPTKPEDRRRKSHRSSDEIFEELVSELLASGVPMNETTDAIVSDLADFLESRGGRYSLVDRNVISGQIAQRVQRWNPKETLSTTFSRALFEVADRKVEDYRNESISFTENMVKTTGPDFIDRWKLRSEQSREAGEARSNRRRNEVELEAIGKTGSREESIEPLLTRFEKFLPGSLAKEFNAWFSSLPKQNRDHLLRGLDFLEVNPDFIVSNQHLRSLIVGQRPDRKFAELRGTGDPQVRVVLSPVNVDQPRIIRSFGLRRDLDDLIRTADLRTP